MKPNRDAIVATHSLAVRVPGRNLVEGLDLELFPGQFIAVLGCNGTGKTLTTLTLAGLREPAAGSVQLDGTDIRSLPRSAIAKKLALLPQSVDDIFPATVFDTALIGRHPHIPRFQWESAGDRAITEAALEQMHIAELAERDVLTLSGGERRRLGVAQILAQAPQVYLLDEPTNHLDPQHQLDVLKVFRERANEDACIVASLHDVNLAARFADTCLLLYGDGRWDYGPTNDILDADRLATLYRTPIEAVDWRSRKLFVATGGLQDEKDSSVLR